MKERKNTFGSTVSSLFGCAKTAVKVVENSLNYLNHEIEGWDLRRSVERQASINEIIADSMSAITEDQAKLLGIESNIAEVKKLQATEETKPE